MFKGCHFPDAANLTSIRLYLRYKLSYRDIAELMAERGAKVDRATWSTARPSKLHHHEWESKRRYYEGTNPPGSAPVDGHTRGTKESQLTTSSLLRVTGALEGRPGIQRLMRPLTAATELPPGPPENRRP